MIVHHGCRWLYIGCVPKTGTTLLHGILAFPEVGGVPFRGQHDSLIPPAWLDYETVVSVRNPMTRAQSLYRHLRFAYPEFTSDFTAFCRALVSPGIFGPILSFYLASQADCVRGIRVDRVLHLETIDADLAAWGYAFPDGVGIWNNAENPRVPAEHTRETRRLVQEWAAKDFERFGYDPFSNASSSSSLIVSL
jgi:hypothetical protein